LFCGFTARTAGYLSAVQSADHGTVCSDINFLWQHNNLHSIITIGILMEMQTGPSIGTQIA
jgi:hypothetical protein